jgi:hypothetical protein
VDIATPLGQHLMQLLSSGRTSEGEGGAAGKGPLAVMLSVAQWQQLQQQHEQQQQQVATAVPLSPVGVPVLSGGSPAVDAVAQLLSSPADRHSSSGCSIRSNNSSAGGAPSHAPTATTTGASTASAASVNEPSMQPGSNERLIMQLLRPCAASPFLFRSNAGTPVWGTPSSSRVGLSTLQQQQQLASAPISSNPCDSTTSYPASDPAATTAIADTAASAAGTPQQQQQQSDEAVDLAAELVSLLQSAGSMSPEEKADRVARTFAKTISRLNM